MTNFSVHPVHHPSRSTLVFGGDLDVLAAPQVEPAVDTVIAGGQRHLAIDAANLTFCDSSGLRALFQAHNTVAAAGGTLEFTHVRGQLLRLLVITGLDQVLTIAPEGSGTPRVA